MKRILVCAALAGMLSFAACPANALECQTTVLIPERFAVTMCPNVDPATKFDEKETLKSAKAVRDQTKVEILAIAFYAPDKKPGDGVLALGLSSDLDYGSKNSNGILFTASDEESGKKIEKLIGYEITPKKLWQIYDDNEVVADEDFKDKPVILQIKCTGLAKDPFGKPYLNVPIDQFGLQGLHIYLAKNDPFLRKLKKGQTLMVRAYPKGFTMKTVRLDGEVILIDEPQAKGKKK